MDTGTIIFIKENLIILHYFVGISSFFIGVSPLFLDREKVQKQANVYYIEISAAVFFLFTISMLSLDYISGKPLFKETQCIQIRDSYVDDIPFKQIVKYYQGGSTIKEVGSNHYLLYNFPTKTYSALEITEDFKFKQIKCR